MFHIALFEPRIAPNTGNIIRIAANNGCTLHLIEPLGFDFEEKKLRRAGLDYHDLSNVTRHADFASFKVAMADRRILAITTKGTCRFTDMAFQADDVLLFGSETSGLSAEAMASVAPELRLRIPMKASSRSMNLSNAVAVVSFEAWRQLDFQGAV